MQVPRVSNEDIPGTGTPLLKSINAESPKHQTLPRFWAFTPQAMMLQARIRKRGRIKFIRLKYKKGRRIKNLGFIDDKS